MIRDDAEMLIRLARIETLDVGIDMERPPSAAVEVVDAGQVFVPLSGLIDIEAERAKLQKSIDEIAGQVQKAQAKLANEKFTSRAPAEIVEREQARHDELAEKLKLLEANLADMQ